MDQMDIAITASDPNQVDIDEIRAKLTDELDYPVASIRVRDRETGTEPGRRRDSWSATPEAMSFVLDHIRSLVCGHDECVVGLPCTRPYEGNSR